MMRKRNGMNTLTDERIEIGRKWIFREKQKDEFEATMMMIYADDYLLMRDENEKMKHTDEKCEAKEKKSTMSDENEKAKHMEEESEKKEMKVKDLDIPNRHGTHVTKPTRNEKEKLKKKNQRQYRSEVGLLIYLLKHVRIDLFNSVRELVKVIDGAMKEHVKMMIKMMIDTKDREMIMTKKKNETKQKVRDDSDLICEYHKTSRSDYEWWWLMRREKEERCWKVQALCLVYQQKR